MQGGILLASEINKVTEKISLSLMTCKHIYVLETLPASFLYYWLLEIFVCLRGVTSPHPQTPFTSV